MTRSKTDPLAGLTEQTAVARQRQEGFNELPQAKRRSSLDIAILTLREPLFALLLLSAAVYFALGDTLEALVLAAFATVSVAITVVQESRSERVLEALRDLSSPRALVIRDGRQVRIPGREVVRGDILLLTEGDRVAADGVVLSGHDLLLDESLLTGESVAVEKTNAPQGDFEKLEIAVTAPGGDGQSVVFAGSLILRGSGTSQVIATGTRSEIGKIGKALASISTEEPRLRKQIRWIVRDFAIFGVVIGFVVVALYGLILGSWLRAVLAGIAVGMSMLPEEFPLVLAVFMAMGARRISRAHVLTRRVAAIETLGSATVICTDKTGTLTENRMTVAAMIDEANAWHYKQPGSPPSELAELLSSARLASRPNSPDPMDRAVCQFDTRPSNAMAVLERTYGLAAELRMMTNVWRSGDGSRHAYAKGAPEDVLRLCCLEPAALANIVRSLGNLANDGMRVLGVASASIKADLPEVQSGFAFRFLGLIGFMDPLRPDVPDAIRACTSAGIRVVMITGDHPNTARSIAAAAGFPAISTVTGDELSKLPDEDMRQALRTANVFARIRPVEKLRLVEGLKASGETVAMTGDGVNDAPALKAAHIGVAMGGRGTDIAREASSIVLLHDDFGSLVKTIRLGRRIYDNLRKAMAYIVAVHIPIAGLAVLPLALGLPPILTPIHIAFLEMVIDPACSIVFEAEPDEDDVMKRPPRDPSTPLLSKQLVMWSFVQGLAGLLVVALALFLGQRLNMPEGDLRSLAFTTLVGVNVSLIFVNRSFDGSLASELRRRNRSLWILVTGVAAVLSLALLSNGGRALFHFGPMHPDDLLICGALSFGMLVFLNSIKRKWRTAFQ